MKEQNYQKLKKAFQKLAPANKQTYFAGIGLVSKELETAFGAPCHSGLRNNYSLLASGFGPNQKQLEVAENFWSFISDTDTSPWRYIFYHPVEKVYNKDTKLPTGFILSPELLESVSFSHIKSFCILMRTITEKHGSFVFWNDLVHKFNLDPRDALYLCSYYQYLEDNHTLVHPLAAPNIGGWHWALYDITDNPYSNKKVRFDWHKFYTGVIPKEKDLLMSPQTVNNSFLSRNDCGYVAFGSSEEYKSIKLRVRKGKFSTSSSYDPEEVVNAFLSWKQKYVKTDKDSEES